MSTNWYLAREDNTQYGPYSDQQLQEFITSGRVAPTDMIWKEGMAEWSTVSAVFGSTMPPPRPMPFPTNSNWAATTNQDVSGTKIAAGLCAILIGCLGIHKFVLGMSTPGLIMLLVSLLTFGIGAIPMGIIGLVEGIIYMTKSDAEFHRIYMVQKKAWF